MKKTKLLLFASVILSITVLLSSCDMVKKIINKVMPPKTTENAESSDTDITDDSQTVENSEGNKSDTENNDEPVAGDSTDTTATDNTAVDTTIDMNDAMPWPIDFITGVPELGGKIIDVTNNNDTKVTVSLDYVEKTDFEAFIELLKQNSYTVESDISTSVDSINFSSYNEVGEWIYAYLTIGENNNNATVEMEKPAVDETSTDVENTPTTEETETLQQGNISITPPEGWAPVDGSVIPVQYMKNTASFMVKTESFAGTTLDEVVTEAKTAFEGAFDNVQFIGNEVSIIVDDEFAYQLIFTCEVVGMKMKYEYVYLFVGPTVYAITFADLEETFDSLAPDYEQILSDIKFS